jgi:hypothetical protein
MPLQVFSRNVVLAYNVKLKISKLCEKLATSGRVVSAKSEIPAEKKIKVGVLRT